MEWISIKDRLPEDDKDVLIIFDAFGASEFNVANNDPDGWVDYRGDFIEYEVTHWMPLPEPPK